jgi:transcriptional regulator with XRE-family HTH domain
MWVSREFIVSDIYSSVGRALRNLRVSFEGRGLSQAELGRALNIPANTISRWETGMYKPSLEDLEILARYFGVPIAHLFSEAQPSPLKESLWSALDGLGDAFIEEMIRYALFRRATLASNIRNSTGP